MQREKKAKNFLPKASYPGGSTALRAFIQEHLTYPSKAVAAKVEGTVVLRLDIDYKGNVKGSKVKSSLGYGCDEEAQRVVNLLKFEIDQKLRKGKILFHKNINIHFKLPKTKPTTELTYQITKKKSENKKKVQPSYSYTITI